MLGLKVYCLGNSGQPITPYMSDVLLLNCYDMWHERTRHVNIKSRRVEGYIKSNLEPIIFCEVPAVAFEAIMSGENNWGNQIKFMIRIDDLNTPPRLELNRVQAYEKTQQGMRPINGPFNLMGFQPPTPEQIQELVEASLGGEDEEYDPDESKYGPSEYDTGEPI